MKARIRAKKAFLFPAAAALLGLSSAFAGSPPAIPFRLCYFSMNNEREFQVLQAYVASLGPRSRVSVEEFQVPGMRLEDSFRAMVESGVQCDGLVLSGHHTGAWSGRQGSGKLDLSFIEALACDPANAPFFEQIKAVWLQGCRTLGVGTIEPYEARDPENRADDHAWRVGSHSGSALPQTLRNLNVEFSGTLDQENPLSTRYLRIFPGATVFGWTRGAPGDEMASENIFPRFIALAAEMSQDRSEPPDPVEAQVRVIQQLLRSGSLGVSSPACAPAALTAWRMQGEEQGVYDVAGLPSLLSQGERALLRARELDCLIGRGAPGAVLASVEETLSDPRLIAYGFNAIWERLQGLQSGQTDPGLYAAMLERLRRSPVARDYIRKKLSSPYLGVVRRIDYYAFHRDLHAEKDGALESSIREQAYTELGRELDPERQHLVSGYREILWQSLSKNGLMDREMARRLASHSDPLLAAHAQEWLSANP